LGEVSTIEHLMSALAVHEITDAEIEVTGGELPAIDGSAKVFYDDLHAVGRTGLGERTLPDLFSRVFLQDDLVKIAIAKGVGRWRYEFSRENRWPFYQEAEIESFASYGTEIAPARTFGFEEEVPAMIAAGLARGLDKSSALVIKEDGYRNDALFENEPARHKLLDLIGDLYLSGVPVRFLDVVGERSGHRTNVEAAHRLRLALGLSL
jgi:UDP-3-O-acyl-N-acetylglucosamine deacetylase